MTRRVRLLVLCPFAPRLDAPHGGRVTASLLVRLAERHDVALVCIRGRDEPPTDGDLVGRCQLVEEVEVTRPRPGVWSTRLRQLPKPFWGYPNMVEHAAADGFPERVREAASAWGPDVVQIELAETARHLHGLDMCPAPRVLVDHEPGTRATADWSSAATGVRRWWRRLDRAAWRRFATRAYRSVDAVVVFTDEDAAAVRSIADGVRVATIPFSVELPREPLDPRGDGRTVLFFGGFGHPPNLEAALRLERTIFPRVRARVPDARLQLVGGGATAEMHGLAGDGVEIAGRVESLVPFLDRAAVVVAPLRLGGGMRVKALETMAAGKALVASRRALEGLSPADGSVGLAESDGDVSDAVVDLLSDGDRRHSLATQARGWAEEHLGWEPILAAYGQLYRELLADRE